MLTDVEKEYIYSEIYKEEFKENDRIDFKLQWYENNGELVKDLLSFANTFHHYNCYIVIGIKDKTKEIIGVDENDKNRKDTQKLTDLIGGLFLAQNSYFSVEVDTLKVNQKIIDVIIIENSNGTPFFLSKDYHGAKKGLIYCRRKDTNTSSDKIATDKEIEQLYKKRFQLDQDIWTQFNFLLKEYINWERCETINGITVIFHKIQPDFYIKIRSEKNKDRVFYDSFSIDEIHPEISYYQLELCFHSIKLKVFTLVTLDEGRKWLIWPKFSSTFKNGYYYEYMDSIEYYITMLLNNKTNENVYNNVVLYKDKIEKEIIEKDIDFNISNQEIIKIASNVKSNFRNPSNIMNNELNEVIKRYLMTKKIKYNL